jgi:hypothetical protein
MLNMDERDISDRLLTISGIVCADGLREGELVTLLFSCSVDQENLCLDDIGFKSLFCCIVATPPRLLE